MNSVKDDNFMGALTCAPTHYQASTNLNTR
jgi:hypothetical protein